MTEASPSSEDEIQTLVHEGQFKAAAKRLESWEDPEVADLILDLAERRRQLLLFRALPRQRAARVFTFFPASDRDRILEAFTDADTRRLVTDLNPDDRTALLEELPAPATRRLMELLSPADLAEARQLLGYPEDSVGRLMTPDYVSLRAEWTCEQAFAHIREVGRDSEILNLLYVTDADGKLVDILRMRRLIMAPPKTVVRDLLNCKYVSISVFEDRETAVEMVQRYDVNALPVVDSEGALLGIVTVDDIFDVAEEEATEDIQKGAAVEPLDMSYTEASTGLLFRKRIGWLVILVFVNLLSAAVIANYQNYLNEYVVLVLFMPLLIASGGNTGAQSATLMVRAIATGELKTAGWSRAISKEVLVGASLGGAMGGLTWLLGMTRGGVDIALVVGASMLSIVLVANLLGVLLPFALSRLKLDPAVASSPLITSTMDAVGLLIYFSIAALVLGL